MIMNKDLLILVGSVSVMFVAVMVILSNSITASNRNFAAIIETETVINNTLVKVNDTLTEQIDRDVNLTRQETEDLIDVIGEIPVLVDGLKNITQTVDKDTKGAIIHRNLMIDNYNSTKALKDHMNEVFSTVVSLNNKIDELFFLKNVTVQPTNVYNATQ